MTSYTAMEINEISCGITRDMIVNYLNALNVAGMVDTFLNNIGYKKEETTEDTEHVKINGRGKILVIGESQLKKDKLLMTAGKEGFDKDRFEFVTNYEDAKTYCFEKLQWNDNYAAVMFGPIPHKCATANNTSSIINRMSNEAGFPPVVRITTTNDLKITKTSFINALRKLKPAGN